MKYYLTDQVRNILNLFLQNLFVNMATLIKIHGEYSAVIGDKVG